MCQGILSQKTPLCLAVSLAILISWGASAAPKRDTDVIKRISLVKKAPVKAPDRLSNGQLTKNISQASFDSDITRELNKYPGIFAVQSIVNGQTPTISFNSEPTRQSSALTIDDRNLGPLPYLDRTLAQYTSLNQRFLAPLQTPNYAISPTGLVGEVASKTDGTENKRRVGVAVGGDKQADINLDYAQQKGKWGHLFQVSHQQRDSYRDSLLEFDNGVETNDVLIKITEQGASLGARNYQQSQFYVHYRDYENDESRFGIANQDIAVNPQRRYSATAQDKEMSDQLTLGLNHHLTLLSGEVVSTHVYYDDGEASYYQTQSVNGEHGEQAAFSLSEFERTKTGTLAVNKASLKKDYTSGGVTIDISEKIGAHDLVFGVGYHKESLDNTVFVDAYSLGQNLELTLTDAKISDAKTELEMNAKSIYLGDTWQNGNLTIDASIKYENLTRELNIGSSNNVLSESSHTFGKVAIDYRLTQGLSLFVNAHQGLLPSTNWLTPSLAQTSQVVRGGLNYRFNAGKLSLVGFNNEFFNVFSRCTTLASCEMTRDERNDISISGVEVSGSYVTSFAGLIVPLSFSYTHRTHEYAKELDTQNIGVQVSVGDELAFLPRDQAFVQAGLQGENWEVALRTYYRGEQRKQPGSGLVDAQQIIDPVTLVDLSARYAIDNKQSLYATVNNVTDEIYVESAFNGTNLIGRGRSLVIGYQFEF